jgi:putative transcriptional regulator
MVQIGWRLHHVMASRDVRTAKRLRELLIERGGLTLSKQAVSDLINKEQRLVETDTLQALCDALDTTPNELYGVDNPKAVSIAREHSARTSTDSARRASQ